MSELKLGAYAIVLYDNPNLAPLNRGDTVLNLGGREYRAIKSSHPSAFTDTWSITPKNLIQSEGLTPLEKLIYNIHD